MNEGDCNSKSEAKNISGFLASGISFIILSIMFRVSKVSILLKFIKEVFDVIRIEGVYSTK